MNKQTPTLTTRTFLAAGLSGWFLLGALDSIANSFEIDSSDGVLMHLIGKSTILRTLSYGDPMNSYWYIFSAPIAHFVLTAYFLAQTIHYFGIAALERNSEHLKIALTSFLTAILSAILIAPSFFINFVNSICRESNTDSKEINVNLEFNEIDSTVSTTSFVAETITDSKEINVNLEFNEIDSTVSTTSFVAETITDSKEINVNLEFNEIDSTNPAKSSGLNVIAYLSNNLNAFFVPSDEDISNFVLGYAHYENDDEGKVLITPQK